MWHFFSQNLSNKYKKIENNPGKKYFFYLKEVVIGS